MRRTDQEIQELKRKTLSNASVEERFIRMVNEADSHSSFEGQVRIHEAITNHETLRDAIIIHDEDPFRAHNFGFTLTTQKGEKIIASVSGDELFIRNFLEHEFLTDYIHGGGVVKFFTPEEFVSELVRIHDA
jgi:hypothetical protein